MTNVQQADRQHGRDWPYTAQEMEQIRQAVQAEAYPPAGRTGIGAVLRRVRG